MCVQYLWFSFDRFHSCMIRSVSMHARHPQRDGANESPSTIALQSDYHIPTSVSYIPPDGDIIPWHLRSLLELGTNRSVEQIRCRNIYPRAFSAHTWIYGTSPASPSWMDRDKQRHYHPSNPSFRNRGPWAQQQALLLWMVRVQTCCRICEEDTASHTHTLGAFLREAFCVYNLVRFAFLDYSYYFGFGHWVLIYASFFSSVIHRLHGDRTRSVTQIRWTVVSNTSVIIGEQSRRCIFMAFDCCLLFCIDFRSEEAFARKDYRDRHTERCYGFRSCQAFFVDSQTS